MDIIEIHNLTKVYNKGKSNAVTAIQNMDLAIKEGEFMAIMGESGSGKSTLLHILGGMDVATSGEILYCGKRMSGRSANWLASYRNREVGFVLQDFGLIAQETVLENVCVPLLFTKTPFAAMKKQARESLRKVGIESLSNRNVSQLSGGQKQRVAIARALVNQPRLILADEPTGALDSKTSEDIVSILEELNHQGKAVVIVTHDINVAKRCGRIVTIADGEIKETYSL